MRSPLLLCALLAASACETSDLGPDGPGGPKGDDPSIPPLLTPPGSTSWGTEQVTCSSEGDCGAGETCTAGVCQMKRCVGGDFTSRPPLGKTYAFFQDRELLVADGNTRLGAYWVDGYEPAVSTLGSGESHRLGAAAIVDLAGGRFFAAAEGFAVATQGSTTVELRGASESASLAVGFVPTGLGRADLDGDHRDEVLAIGAAGKVAVCHVEEERCDRWTVGALAGIDIDGGDVDGDGADELVLIQELTSSKRRVLVWNLGAEGDEGQPRGLDVEAGFRAVAIGDLDKDLVAEIGLLADGGYLGVAGDAVHLYSGVGGLGWRQAVPVDGDSVALAIGDSNADERAELVVLVDHPLADDEVDGYALGEQGYAPVFNGEAGATGKGTRLALADLDGDSPQGTLVEGPTLVAARAVPTLVVLFPPYDREHADGKPFLEVGEHSSTSSSVTDTISLRLGAEVGFEAGVDGLFKASVSAKIDAELSRSRSRETSLSVGSRLSAEPDPERFGWQYGAVVLSCGCFHSYTYKLRDPAGKMGGDGKEVSVVLPVGGQTTLWSTPRYNAMARAVGNLPIIDVPVTIGDLASYPARPTTLAGAAIAPEDLVFPQPPEFVASDVGSVGFTLSAGSSVTNERAMSVALSVAASFNVEGVAFGGYVGAGLGRSYGVTIGEEASFSGSIPPIKDDPATPEDEYALHAYRFRPIVYQARYTDPAGQPAAYYVLTYEVAR